MLRKAFKTALVAALCLAIAAPSFAGIGAIGRSVASAGTGSTPGFLPAGHWITSPISSTPVLIFPQPDSSTSASARVHQAYWDGTNNVPYDLALGVAFGSYPYVFQLISGPPGMTIEQTYYNGFQNVQYGRLSWTPQGNISSAWSGTVEVLVTDQALNTLTIKYSLWTVGPYSTSTLTSANATVTNGSTTFTLNSGTGTVVPGMVITGSTCIPTNDYILPGGAGGGTGNYTLAVAASCSTTESVTGAYGQGAVFVSTSGSGVSCTYSVPCTFTQAFGSTFTTTSYPGALCYVFGGSYSGTPGGSNTNLPYYTDTDTGTDGFETDAATKPNALIGIPGQTVTLDASAADTAGYPYFIQLEHASDWYEENIGANGYNTSTSNDTMRLVNIADIYRITFDQISWSNSGYGNGTSGNETMIFSSGIQSPRQDLFVTDSSETGRESGAVGNNYGFADIYSFNDVLIQRSVENSPSADLDGAFYYKSDVTNGELRENYVNVAGTTHAFGYGQAQYSGTGNDESSYNLGVGVSALTVNFAGSNYTWNEMALFRNTILAGTGDGIRVGLPNTNLGGPWITGVTSASGGSLTSGTEYYYKMTSLGVSGESTAVSGSYGDSDTGQGAGESNQVDITIAAGDGSAVLTWDQEPGAQGYNIYRGTSSGGEEFLTTIASGSTTTYTDTGSSTTATTPPTTSTAVSSYFDNFWNNAISTTGSITTGAIVVAPTTGSNANIFDANTGDTICLAVGAGCAAIGDINTNSSVTVGTAGYQIQ